MSTIDVPTIVAALPKLRSSLSDLFAEIGRIAATVAVIWGLIHGGAITATPGPAPAPPAKPAPIVAKPDLPKPTLPTSQHPGVSGEPGVIPTMGVQVPTTIQELASYLRIAAGAIQSAADRTDALTPGKLFP